MKIAPVLINRRIGEIVPPRTNTTVTVDSRLFEIPPLQQTVWRYLDYFKFRDLLTSRTLYFRRIDCLPDPLEGRFSIANWSSQSDPIVAIREGYGIDLDPAQHFEFNESVRPRYFVNSWHINDAESRDLWRLYTQSADSVVIVSRVAGLRRCAGGLIKLGVVKYEPQNVARADWLSWGPLLYKDAIYKIEREIRLFLADAAGSIDLARDTSRRFAIRPSCLIRLVVLHPHVSNGFRSEVRNLVRRYLPGVPLRESALAPTLW